MSQRRHNSEVTLLRRVVSAPPHPILVVNKDRLLKDKVKGRTEWLLTLAGGYEFLVPRG